VVKVRGVMSPDDLDRWRKGVRLDDGVTLPADVKLLRHESGKTWLELTIREGRNRQVRRMTAAVGCPTLRLIRWSVGPWALEDLVPGRSRVASAADVETFMKESKSSHEKKPKKQK